jgi:hypothetical protein
MSGDTPIAGLWTNNLHSDLFWHTKTPTKRPLTSGIPSWSWASVDGAILERAKPEKFAHYKHSKVDILRVIKIDLQWSGAPLVSQLIRGELVVQGQMRTVVYGGPYSLLSDLEADSKSGINFSCSFFDEEPPLPGSKIICLRGRPVSYYKTCDILSGSDIWLSSRDQSRVRSGDRVHVALDDWLGKA